MATDCDHLLEHADGTWQGTYRLWFRPAETPDAESATTASISRELGGKSLLLRYEWRYEDAPREGIALISRTEGGGIQMGWSDTFHYRDGVMHNAAIGTESKVLGQYGSAEEPWGWRTEFAMPDPDSLEIRAFNILSDGNEALATEALYRRVT